MQASKRRVRTGRIHVHPDGGRIVEPKTGTKQALVADALRKGATMDDLRKICVKASGEPWKDDAIVQMFYNDLKAKGFGVRTDDDMDRGLTYYLIEPHAV